MARLTIRRRSGREELQVPWIAFDVGDSPPLPMSDTSAAVQVRLHQGFSQLIGDRRDVRHVAIAVDDYTRTSDCARLTTPLTRVIRAVLGEAVKVTVLVAGGVHRRTQDAELAAKLDLEVLRGCQVIRTDAFDETLYVDIDSGKGHIGVLRAALECDLLLALGDVRPHVFAGWSGGAKAIAPGVLAPAAVAESHLLAGRNPDPEDVYGDPDTSFRAYLEDLAVNSIGLSAIGTTVYAGRQLVDLRFGDPVRAHRRAVAAAGSLYRPIIAAPADVAIVQCAPHDRDLWQATDGIAAGAACVRPGGTVILVAECPEGLVSGNARYSDLFRRLGSKSFEELARLGVAAEDGVALGVLCSVAAYLRGIRCLIVSSSLSRKDAQSVSLELFTSVEAALDQTRGGVAVGVIRSGTRILPRIVPATEERGIG